MPVIKNNQPLESRAIGETTALNIANFTEQATRIVLKAKDDAQKLLDEARAEVDSIREQARKEGYDEGFAKGQADGHADGVEKAFDKSVQDFSQQTETLRGALRQMLEEFDTAKEEVLRKARVDVLDLALTIAEKITHVYARDSIEAAQASLAKALQMVTCNSRLVARVNPVQLDQLKEYAAQFVEEMGMQDTLEIVADEQMKPGDVVVQSAGGEVDARIDTQIDSIVAAITGRPRNQQ